MDEAAAAGGWLSVLHTMGGAFGRTESLQEADERGERAIQRRVQPNGVTRTPVYEGVRKLFGDTSEA